MIGITERRLKRICQMHPKSPIRVVCADRDLAIRFTIALSSYSNLQLIYVDLAGLIAYEAVLSDDGKSATLSILVDQDRCFLFARKCAKQFEKRFRNLLVDQSASSRYQLYQAAIENWAFHQALLRRVSLLKCALEIHERHAKVTVFAMGHQWRSIAMWLTESQTTYFIQTASALTLRRLIETLRPLRRSASHIAVRIKDLLSIKHPSFLSRLLDCELSPSKAALSSKTLVVLKAKGVLHLKTMIPLLKELSSLGFEDSFDVLDINGRARSTRSVIADAGVTASVFDLFSLDLNRELVDSSYILASVSVDLFTKALSREGEDITKEERSYRLPLETYEELLSSLCLSDLPRLVKLVSVLRRRFSDDKPAVVVTCTDFHWIGDVVRAVALQAGRPIVCVQNAYMSTSPRYSAPAGDVITVIDSWTRDLLLEKFSCDPDTVRVTGTPRFDPMAELARSVKSEAYAQLGDNAGHSRPTILFAAQPEDRSVSTIDIIDSLAGVRVATSIIIKLHPSAPPELVTRAQRHAEARSGRHTITVERTGNIQELMKNSDVLVTVSSNVGVEAAIADKDIVIAKFRHFDHVLPLDEFDIGLVARSSSELTEAVESVLESENTRALLRGKRQRYAELNPRLFAGDSRQVISRIIVETFTEKASLSSRPIPKLRLATSV